MSINNQETTILEDEDHNLQEALIENDEDFPDNHTKIKRNETQEIINQTFQATTNLANLLPTGTFLAFQMLSPAFTNQGDCISVNRVMHGTLLAFFAISSFLLNFTDSYRDRCGNICYGIATFNGLWFVDCSEKLPQRVAYKYRLKVSDFVHAFTSVLVFTAIALSESNTVRCFFPSPSRDLQQILAVLPLVIGLVGSLLFVLYPTKRHGIGHTLAGEWH